jgi:hypothetical protein
VGNAKFPLFAVVIVIAVAMGVACVESMTVLQHAAWLHSGLIAVDCAANT